MTETPNPAPLVSVAASAPAESVIIRPWPKIVFLYPTFVAATIFFLLSWTGLVAERTLGNAFMVIWLINLLVFSFDFSRIWSIVGLMMLLSCLRPGDGRPISSRPVPRPRRRRREVS